MNQTAKRLSRLVLPVALLLGGCAVHPGPALTDYALAPATAASERTAPLPVTLRVDDVTAPDWLNSRNFYYRLDYVDPQQIAAYGRSQWLSAPPTLLHTVLLARLSQSGLFRAVIGGSDTAQANYDLRLRLLAFEQDFKTPKTSSAYVRLHASLIDDASGTVKAQKFFVVRVPAGQDAQSGAAALNYAANEVAGAMAHWLRAELGGARP